MFYFKKFSIILFLFAFWPVAIADDRQIYADDIRFAEKNHKVKVDFLWKEPIDYKFVKQKNKLIVWFDRKNLKSLSALAKGLEDYVEKIEKDNNGKLLTFYLFPDVKVETSKVSNHHIQLHFYVENNVFLSNDHRKSLEAKLAVRSVKTHQENQPKVNRSKRTGLLVRVGKHKGFDRIVFDWRKPVAYSIRREENKIFFIFSDKVSLSKEHLMKKLPSYLKLKEDSFSPKDQLKFQLTMSGPYSLKHFALGNRIVVDFRKAALNVKALKVIEEKPLSNQKTETIEKEVLENSDKKDELQKKEAQKKPVLEKKILHKLEKQLTGDEEKPVSNETPVENEQLEKEDPAYIKIRYDNFIPEESIRLIFPWTKDVKSVVYNRGNNHYIIFDRFLRVDFSEINSLVDLPFDIVQQVPHKDLTILKIRTSYAVIKPFIEKDGTQWSVRFKEGQRKRLLNVTINKSMNNMFQAYLWSPINEKFSLHSIKDPEVGDLLYVVPIENPTKANFIQRDFPEVSYLQTSLGVVIKPLSTTLRVEHHQKGIFVKAPRGLNIIVDKKNKEDSSPDAPIQKVEQKRNDKFSRLFENDKLYNPILWSRKSEGSYLGAHRRFQVKIAEIANSKNADSNDLNYLRLQLAQFYFSNSMAYNALGLLKLIENDNPLLNQHPHIIALWGASYLMLGDYKKAEKKLFNAKLDRYDEVRFWRAAVKAGKREFIPAAKLFKKLKEFPSWYSNNIVNMLTLYAVETDIVTNNLKRAEKLLTKISKQVKGDQLAQSRYLEGVLYWLKGKKRVARLKWESLEGSTSNLIRAKAKLALIESKYIDKIIKPKEAIDQLEGLRYVGRGTDFEFKLLKKLGEVYLFDKKTLKGLQTLRLAIKHFPDKKENKKIVDKMKTEFVSYFIDQPFENLSPIKTVALYSEFKELTPAGKEGAVILRKLIKQLLAVDLFDHATKLLNELINTRLEGLEKQKARLQLAMIYFEDRQYSKSIKILDAIEPEFLQGDFASKIYQIKSMAAYKAGDKRKAIDIISKDNAETSKLVKAQIYWDSGDWQEVSKIYYKIINRYDLKDEKNTDYLGGLILNLAISLSFQTNQEALAKLKEQYSPFMIKTKYADLFSIAADEKPLVSQYGDISSHAKVASSSIDIFDGYLKKYKDQWLNEKKE